MLDARQPGASALSHPSFEELYAVARSHLSERLRLLKVPPEDIGDVVHEVVLIAHRKLGVYRPPDVKPGDLLGPRHALEAWLSGIAWRYVAKRRAKAHRRLELPAGDGATLHAVEGGDVPSSEQLAAEAQRRELLRRVLHKLRPERAEVLVMHSVFQMPVPDIADELSLNENTVKSRLARARRDAIAAVKRLSPDERSALQGSPLLLPLALDTSREIAPPVPRAPSLSPPRAPSMAALGGTFILGMAIGVHVGGHRGRGIEAPVVVAAPDVVPAETRSQEVAPTDPSAPTVMAPAPVFGIPAATKPSVGTVAPAPRALETMARERDGIRRARRAVEEGAFERALSILGALDQEIPRGAFMAERTLLRREVARGRDGEAPVR